VEKIEVLVVGGDDSNHAASSPKYELNVATFSTLYEDSIVETFHNTRDYDLARRWIEKQERDFRFAILTKEKYAHSSTNLVLVIPKIIHLYLNELDLSPENLKVYLDGRIGRGNRDYIIPRKPKSVFGRQNRSRKSRLHKKLFLRKERYSKSHS